MERGSRAGTAPPSPWPRCAEEWRAGLGSGAGARGLWTRASDSIPAQGSVVQVCNNASVRGVYDDVRALQLGRGGRTAAVLRGDGLLDFWQLQTGTLVGQWRLGASYSAMCHDATTLRMARQEPAGPVLEAIDLPSIMVEAMDDLPNGAAPEFHGLASEVGDGSDATVATNPEASAHSLRR